MRTRTRRRLALGAALLAAAVSSRAAYAAEIVSGADVGLLHSTAVAGDGAYALIPYLDLHVGGAVGPFELGLRTMIAHDLLFGRSESLIGPYVGIATHSPGFSAGLFVDGGEHEIYDIGDGLFSEGTSQTAELPFVGGGARLAGTLARRVTLGGSVFVARDVGTQEVTVARQICALGCDGGPYPTTYDVGGTMVGFAVSVTYQSLPLPF